MSYLLAAVNDWVHGNYGAEPKPEQLKREVKFLFFKSNTKGKT